MVDNIQSFENRSSSFHSYKIDNFPQLSFENTLINFVADHKQLGLTFSNNGHWHKYIRSIITSAAKAVGIMRKLK